MKLSKPLLISATLNVFLAVGMAYLVKQPVRPAVDPDLPAPTSGPSPPTVQRRIVSQEQPSAKVSGFDWRQVESEDYRQYIANLRAIGCPEETIRDIIIADISKLYAPRLVALRSPDQEIKYWQSQNSRARRPNMDKVQQIRALEREKRLLLQDLLGVDAQEEINKMLGRENSRSQQYSFLPLEKREPVREILERYSVREQEIHESAAEEGSAVDVRKEVARLRQERQNELAAIMTPDELQQYELRHSETAQRIKSSLAGFDQTETEFQKIFQVRKAYEEQYGPNGSLVDKNDPLQKETWQQARGNVDERLRAELGEQRYAEYVRARDPSYQELSRLAERFDLAAETTARVYDMKRTAEAQVKQVQADSTIPNDQKIATLKAIQAETERSLGEALGEKVLKAYRSSGGRWVRGLSPSRPRAAANAAPAQLNLDEVVEPTIILEPSP